MIGKIFGVICLIALLFGIYSGNGAALGGAIPDGAAKALEVTLSLTGMMCLWCGFMEVLKEAGAVERLSRLLRPVLRRIFPKAWESGEGAQEIAANISANLLGIGNAATPMGLRAMERMQKHNPNPDQATSEQITLMVMNTAPLSLFPTTVFVLRHAAGSAIPYAVLIPVWIVSLASAALSVFLCRIWTCKSKTVKRVKKHE